MLAILLQALVSHGAVQGKAEAAGKGAKKAKSGGIVLTSAMVARWARAARKERSLGALRNLLKVCHSR